ncbi:MAG: alpha/beta hydrolase fold domain-containing protein [Neoaquamicrobium sediminum]|uniref:alpha/beta hydrolase fold domain-containing protein n=1 Tax=Neoaquamicrobium sediminum TaxID=1849104 RepID=UPI004035E2C6
MSALDRYRHLLDADLAAFIEAHERGFPPDLDAQPLDRQRAVYGEMCRAFHAPTPADIEILDTALEFPERTIRLRIYRPLGRKGVATVLYFHGGGFVFGDLDSHGDMCAELCSRADVDVISVDYRLAPEHLHPAAFDDAMAAFAWTARSFRRPPILFGESAGGALAGAVAHKTRYEPASPRGLVLVYPGLGSHGDLPSFSEHAGAPLLSAAEIGEYQAARLGDAGDATDPAVNPLRDTDYAGLPRTFVSVPEFDPLRDEGELYCERIRAVGGNAVCTVEPGLVHSFLRARTRVARAAEAFDRIVEAVKSMSAN